MLKNVVNLQFISEVRPDISKSVLNKSRLHNLNAFIEKKKLATEICIKFESEEISITGDYCSKSEERGRSRERYGRLRCVTEDEAIRKVIDSQQGEAKRRYRGFITIVINIIIIVLLLVLFGRVDIFILVFVLCVISFHKLKIMLRCCGDYAFSASFVRACTDVSHVAVNCT